MSAGVVLLSIYCSKSTLALSYFRFIYIFFKKNFKKKGRACAGAVRLLVRVAQAGRRLPSAGPLLP